MDASGADKLILLVQTNPVLYDKSAAEYKVKVALEKGDIWQIGVDIAVNSERTTDLRCRFSFLVSWWRCDRYARFLVSRFSFLVPRFSFLVSRWRCDRALKGGYIHCYTFPSLRLSADIRVPLSVVYNRALAAKQSPLSCIRIVITDALYRYLLR